MRPMRFGLEIALSIKSLWSFQCPPPSPMTCIIGYVFLPNHYFDPLVAVHVLSHGSKHPTLPKLLHMYNFGSSKWMHTWKLLLLYSLGMILVLTTWLLEMLMERSLCLLAQLLRFIGFHWKDALDFKAAGRSRDNYYVHQPQAFLSPPGLLIV